MRSTAKDDRGDPTKYGFLLIGRSEGLLQLYFILVFIYTFIKVKSKSGKKRDGCAMAKWLQPFSFGSKSYKQSECERPSPTATPIKHKIPYLEPENIREFNLDFTAHFGEINPDMLYLCRRSLSGPKRLFLPFSPLFGGSR